MTTPRPAPGDSTDILLGITFGQPLSAHELVDAVARAGALPQTSAVVVTRTADGSVRLIQTTEIGDEDLGWAGPWWGLLVATVYAASVAGALWGISLGPLWNRLGELGLSAEWMDFVARDLPPGGSAAFFLMDAGQRDAILTFVDAEAVAGVHEIIVPAAVRAEVETKLSRAKPD